MNYRRYFVCSWCLVPCETELATLCNACFDCRRKETPPRQSGRTLNLIRQLDNRSKSLLVMPHENSADLLRCDYPWLRKNIETVNSVTPYNLFRAMSANNICLDHAIWEHAVSNEMLSKLVHELKFIGYFAQQDMMLD